VIQDGSGNTIKEYQSYIGEQTNNVAEYTALLDAMRLALELGGKNLKIYSDSQLLVRQFNGKYRIKNDRLFKYLAQIQHLRQKFSSVELIHIPREENKRADQLANAALDVVEKN
jgi:ribonuclease HI